MTTSVYVKLPGGMTRRDGCSGRVCPGSTVREVIDQFVLAEPRVRSKILCDDGSVHASVLLNGCDVRTLRGLATPVREGDRVSFMPHICGS